MLDKGGRGGWYVEVARAGDLCCEALGRGRCDEEVAPLASSPNKDGVCLSCDEEIPRGDTDAFPLPSFLESRVFLYR